MANLKRRLKKQQPLGAYGIVQCVCGKIVAVDGMHYHRLKYSHTMCAEQKIFQSKLNSEA